ncbi:MAG: hypothetical protein ACOYL3_13365 [Desulfuromonadaceae bacterium]
MVLDKPIGYYRLPEKEHFGLTEGHNLIMSAEIKTNCKRNSMDLDSDQKELVELFVKQEFLIGVLYKLFARRYPEYKEFWSKMAKEELQHATLIKRMVESDSLNKIKFSQGELRASVLASSMKFIEGTISEFKNNENIPVIKAARVALQLEQGLWEKKVFQFFDGDSDEVRRIMEALNSEQELHIIQIDNFRLQFLEKSMNKI